MNLKWGNCAERDLWLREKDDDSLLHVDKLVSFFPFISFELLPTNQLIVNQFELRQTDKSAVYWLFAQISLLIIPAYTSIKLSILTVYWHNLWISHQSYKPSFTPLINIQLEMETWATKRIVCWWETITLCWSCVFFWQLAKHGGWRWSILRRFPCTQHKISLLNFSKKMVGLHNNQINHT